MKWLLGLSILPILTTASPLALEDVVMPDPSQVHINGVTFGGTGCPQGTVGTAISADRSTLTLIFDQYVASIGPNVAITENRKNCQLNIDLLYPPGFQYSVFSVDYRGYAALTANVTGTLKSTYYFSGSTAQVRLEKFSEIRISNSPQYHVLINQRIVFIPGLLHWSHYR